MHDVLVARRQAARPERATDAMVDAHLLARKTRAPAPAMYDSGFDPNGGFDPAVLGSKRTTTVMMKHEARKRKHLLVGDNDELIRA